MALSLARKVTRCIERSLENKLPLVIVSVSGGMRMQEGTLALMQMAKTAAACAEYAKEGVSFIFLLSPIQHLAVPLRVIHRSVM